MKPHLLLLLFAFISSTLLSQTTDASGKKQGYWKKTDEKTGKLIYEGLFKDDKPVGKFKYYYPNDSVQAIMNFKDGGKIAYAKLFNANGKKMGEGKYISEQKDSVWTFYDDGGFLISRDNYKMGKKNGKCLVYLPDGLLSEERNFKDGIDHGDYKLYFDGKAVKSFGTYVDGKLEGKNAFYFPGGIEAAVGYYKNGVKTGPWIYKDSKGKVTEKELYKNGQLANAKDTEAFFNKNKTPGTEAKNTPDKPVKKTGK